MIVPEDDANRAVALGFSQRVWHPRNLQVLQCARGWWKVIDRFEDTIPDMARYPQRLVVLLIDFDGDPTRRELVRQRGPPGLADRVFVLGSLTEPEFLKPDLGNYELIGRQMADECREGGGAVWGHPLLKHNADELDRLGIQLKLIVFGP